MRGYARHDGGHCQAATIRAREPRPAACERESNVYREEARLTDAVSMLNISCPGAATSRRDSVLTFARRRTDIAHGG